MVCRAHRLMKMLNLSFAFRISVMDTHNYIFMNRRIKKAQPSAVAPFF